MLTRKGVNRPVMKPLCVREMFACMTAWSQEEQHNQDCLSKTGDQVTATKRDKRENWHLLCVSSIQPDIFKCIILFSVLINAKNLLCSLLSFLHKETKLVED